MDQQDRVTVIAQLRQARRLMSRGGLTIAEALEVLKVYEQGVATTLTADQLLKYIEARMLLAEDFYNQG